MTKLCPSCEEPMAVQCGRCRWLELHQVKAENAGLKATLQELVQLLHRQGLWPQSEDDGDNYPERCKET